MSTPLIIVLISILVMVLIVQIARLTELSGILRGDEETEARNNRSQAMWLLIFMVLFLVFCIGTAIHYKDYMLGFGPLKSSSIHGEELDSIFYITLFFTGIVFVATQVALFWFSYRYRGEKGRKALFLAHNNKLEIWWSVIPALVMCGLVAKGLVAWNKVMADVNEDEDAIEIEATGMQFNWILRYPGPDGALGTRDYHKITAANPLGQDYTDEKNLDDFLPDELVLPVNKKVRVRIMARDVLHNFYLPHFRVKMDAVPGIPTYFVFTPKETTQEFRDRLRASGKYEFLYDDTDPSLGPYWKNVNFELACAELCGKGHFSMRKTVRIVSDAEYQAWLSNQKSYYLNSIRNSDEDPYKGQLLNVDVESRKAEFMNAFSKADTASSAADRIVQLKYVQFETGSATLTALSRYELGNLIDVLNDHPDLRIELAGHTDSTGDATANQELSQQRAEAVLNYLTDHGINGDRLRAVGYGQNRPIDTNETEEGRQNNRRTEFQILN
ncbi:MAG: OmpA family protein [Saprospiraceae bacterium]|nr:OmpA family protein [Saprospiraceae bacterium]